MEQTGGLKFNPQHEERIFACMSTHMRFTNGFKQVEQLAKHKLRFAMQALTLCLLPEPTARKRGNEWKIAHGQRMHTNTMYKYKTWLWQHLQGLF